MKTGFSYYFGTDSEKNKKIFEKAKNAGMEYVFTSLHIPEEKVDDYRGKVVEFIDACKTRNFKFMVDVSPHTLEKLGCDSYDELKKMGVDYLRLDFGFTNEEIVSLSKTFYIVFNSSTMNKKDVAEWQALGADFSRFFASHNFYPKPLTALSLEKVRDTNHYFSSLGFTTMAFVAGDKDYRGPIFEGLPTVEDHRDKNVLLNMLELFYQTQSDVVLVGDVDISDRAWEQIYEFNKGYISLRADVNAPYEYIKGTVHHDRLDSSPYVLRSVESRQETRKIPAEEAKPRPLGAIWISNENYLRYEGELEISRADLEADKRVNVVGQIHNEDLKYLPYIIDGFGFKLV